MLLCTTIYNAFYLVSPLYADKKYVLILENNLFLEGNTLFYSSVQYKKYTVWCLVLRFVINKKSSSFL